MKAKTKAAKAGKRGLFAELIKKFPSTLHQRLKQRAARNHRSMTKEVIAVLEHALAAETAGFKAPPPFTGRFALTNRFLDKAKRAGRE